MKNRIQLAAVVGSVVIFVGCQAVGAIQFDGTTHRYYIAADEVVWDYAPTRQDLTTGQEFDSLVACHVRDHLIGGMTSLYTVLPVEVSSR